MAADFPKLDPDSEAPAVLGKADALIAKHRGQGTEANVPVLTDLVAVPAQGAIPVLTDIAPIVGEELMFTPEEIRAEAPPPKAAELPPAAPSVFAPSRPAPAPVEDSSIDLLELPPPEPSKPAPPSAPPPAFDFPELTLPDLHAAPPARTPPPPPAVSGPLMPELALNFDFAPPPDETVKPSAPAPVAAPVPPPTAAPAPAALDELSIELPDEAFPVAMSAIDPAALASELLASLKPEVEKLLRAEMARQIAGLHVEALKRTLGALQPQLDKLVRTRIDEALKLHK